MTLSLNRIDVAVLFVADVERAKSFYRDVLGLQANQEDDDGAFFPMQGASLILLTVPGAQDLLSTEAVAGDGQRPASSQLVIFVKDVDAAYGELVAKGVEFIREPIDRAWGMRTAHFKDPDGHIWELAQQLGQD